MNKGEVRLTPTRTKVIQVFQDFQQLDQWFTQQVANLSTVEFCASHPAWVYLFRDYGLNQIAVLEEGHGKEPTPRQLKEIIDLMRENLQKLVETLQ